MEAKLEKEIVRMKMSHWHLTFLIFWVLFIIANSVQAGPQL